jgi:oligopeptide transport system substrate-binding protein
VAVRYFLSVLYAATLFVGGLSCTRKDDSAQNILRVPVKEDLKTLDPANAYDDVSLDVLPNIMESLLQYKYLDENMVLEPLLAESMPEYSKDGLSARVSIRKGIKFQDDPCFRSNGGKGRELRADDFVFAFKRLAIPSLQSQGAWIFQEKIVGFDEFEKRLHDLRGEELKKAFAAPIDGLAALDDHTIQFKFTRPYPLLNYILAMTFTAPVAREAVEAYADKDGNLRDHPIGTGPFQLKSWEPGSRVVISRNPNFKGAFPANASDSLRARGLLADAGKPIPFLDGVSFEIIREEAVRMSRFLKKEIDLLEIMKDTWRSLMSGSGALREDLAKEGVQVDPENSLVDYYVIFNVKDKILQNKYLRQAISSAVDRAEWIESFEKGRGIPQDQVGPPGLVDRVSGAKIKYDFNLERAKQLLSKAGYPEGKGLPVLNFDFRGIEQRYEQMGEMFVRQLGAIGIRVNPILNSFPAYLEKAKLGKMQLSLGGWTFDYPDVENGYQILYGPNRSPGPNDSNWENPKFDALYKKIASTPPGAKGRSDWVAQAESLIQEEVPWAYGYFLKVYLLSQPRVWNHHTILMIQNKYKYLRIDADGSDSP